jgi:putative ABC transport system substrate-binding protein
MGSEMASKRLELLLEVVPQAKVIALLVNPINPNVESVTEDVQEAASRKGVKLLVLKASSDAGIEDAFDKAAQSHATALLFAGDPFFASRYKMLAWLALQHAIPAAWGGRGFAGAGGLISYSPRLTAVYRQAGVYAGRILNGEKPADLPVQQPTQFDLIVNMKTANMLGITLPQSLLSRADWVIEY